MFYDTKIEILQSPEDVNIKTIDADVQPYSGTVAFDYGLSLEISKRVFCDADTEITEQLYFRIDNVYYKVLNVKGWSDHMEIFLYRCKRLMERTIDEMIDFFLFEKGEDVLLNNIGYKAVVLDATDKINIDADKIIHCKVEIMTGDIVEHNGRKYIITSQIDKNQNSFCARMKQCNYSIAFNFTGNVKWFNALIETKVMDINTNQYMSLASGTIKVSLQDNADSRDIAIGSRLINTARAWQVNGIGLVT